MALGFVELPNRDPSGGSDLGLPLADVAATLADLISSTPGDLPWVLFGHSLGALIAFETARCLSESPALAGLMVSGRRAPSIESREAPLSGLPEPAFLAAMQARYNAIPPQVLQEPELLALLLPRLRAGMAMVETYRYRPAARLGCPLFVYGGEADPHAPPPQLPPWANETTNRCEVRLFDGGHFFLQETRAALLDVLARDLSTCGRQAVRSLGCG